MRILKMLPNRKLITIEEFHKQNNGAFPRPVTSVHGVIIDSYKNVGFNMYPVCVMTVNKQRGIDWIGGHVEDSDLYPINTLIREAYEEALIDITDGELKWVIQIDNRKDDVALNKGYPEIGYQLFYLVKPEQFSYYPAHTADFADDVTGRVLVIQPEIKHLYNGKNAGVLNEFDF